MKKTYTRLTAILLVLAMFVTLIPAVSATDGYDNWWEEYVDTPMEDWSIEGVNEDGVVTSQGNYILFTSDLHRYTYLTKDLLSAANNMIQADGNTGNVGLVAFGGDFANEYSIYADNMSILKAAIASSEGTVAAYTKGNHERDVSDEDFKALTGMSRVGETVVNAADAYYFYNFGVNGKDQTFLEDDIADLSAYLEAHNDGKPVFIVSHFPIHYYNDRRVTKNAAKLVEVLNQYPQTVFLWGHNHTESDPAYGYIRSAGDVIQTEASVDSTVEINFTYANLGALRDGTNGANGLLVRVDDGVVNYRYINLHNSSSEVKWIDAQNNENTVRVPIEPDAAQNTETNDDFDTVPDLSVIQLSNIKIDRPLVDVAPAETAGEYSDRFYSGPIEWSTADGPVTGNFDFNTVYTASVTLSAEDGFNFPSDASVSVNKLYVGPMPGKDYRANVNISEDGKTVTLDYSFAPTTGQSDVQLDPATAITEGKQYVVAAIDSNYAASYIYIPEDHGEESKPEYKTVPADVVIREGQLVSELTPDMLFTAQKDNEGYILWSDASLQKFKDATEDPRPNSANYLNMSTRGGDLGLEAAESLTYDCYCDFDIDDAGLPYINMDGAIVYAAFEKGAFTFVSDPAACNVRLYEVGDNTETTELSTVSLVVPAAGSEDITCSAGAAVQSVTWEGSTATIVVAPEEGKTLASILDSKTTARVNGEAADAVIADGQITVTYTYPEAHEAGKRCFITGVEADAFTDGGEYIIVSGGVAMTSGNDGVYQAGTPVTVEDGRITSAITEDMIITVEGNSNDGFALKTQDGYVMGYSANGSPDTWGITYQAKAGVTVNYVDGKLVIISTGKKGGPPKKESSYYYENKGHFNISSLQPDDFAIYEVTVPFTDVPEGQYYAKNVAWGARNGIVAGTSSSTFTPNGSCTRAEALTFLYRLAGKPEPTGSNPFTDVKEDDYFYKAVLWAVENKITSGTSKTTFSPDKTITRAEFVAFLYRYAGKPEPTGSNTFTDVKEGDYFYKAAVWGAENKVVYGTSTGVFSPNENCSRAQVVTFLHRYANLPS